jgi:hypothetical protein
MEICLTFFFYIYLKPYLINLILQGPTICKNIRNLLDSNGNYLKTVCTVYSLQTQSVARTTCSNNRMQLYRFVLPDDEKALLDYSDAQWPYNRLWVEGGNATRGLMVSNQERDKFGVINMPVTTLSYFYCEYRSRGPLIASLPSLLTFFTLHRFDTLFDITFGTR